MYLWGLDQKKQIAEQRALIYRKTKEKLLIYPNLATRTLGNCSPATIWVSQVSLAFPKIYENRPWKRTDWKMTFPFWGNALSSRTIVDVEPQNGVHHGFHRLENWRHFFGSFHGVFLCDNDFEGVRCESECLHKCLCVYQGASVCICVWKCACVYVSKWMCNMCMCLCMWVHVCVYNCIHTKCIYICAWIILHPTCTPNSLPSTGTCLLDIG